jgi:hypothetical protein
VATEWRENPAGMRQLLVTPAAVKAVEHVGELVRVEAERIAPVVTGAYAFGVAAGNGAHDGGFKVEPFVNGGAAAVRIVNRVRSAPSKHWPNGFGYGSALEHGLEWVDKRTGKTHVYKRQRILGRALDALNVI